MDTKKSARFRVSCRLMYIYSKGTSCVNWYIVPFLYSKETFFTFFVIFLLNPAKHTYHERLTFN